MLVGQGCIFSNVQRRRLPIGINPNSLENYGTRYAAFDALTMGSGNDIGWAIG